MEEERLKMRNRKKAETAARELVSQMTLEEKASQLRYDSPAIPRLGVPAYNWWNEALHGVARAGVATSFPQAIGMAASFDTARMKEVATAISDEARAKYNEYRKFGDTYLAAVGKTPRQYFAEMSDSALVETLKEYLLQELPVSDFLCEEIERRGVFPELLSLLDETDEELVHYAINLIGAHGSAVKRYAEMLASDDYDEHIKDNVAELLKQRADAVTEEMLALLGTENEPYALEILSGTKKRDDRVYNALLAAFREAEEADLPLYAGYLAAYGDERALPVLLREIEREDIGFVAFQELKFAIEALGGEYEKQRDFSQDEAYKKIMAASAGSDIFGMKKK